MFLKLMDCWSLLNIVMFNLFSFRDSEDVELVSFDIDGKNLFNCFYFGCDGFGYVIGNYFFYRSFFGCLMVDRVIV